MVKQEDDTPPLSPEVSDLQLDPQDDMIEVIEVDGLYDYEDDDDNESFQDLNEPMEDEEEVIYHPDVDHSDAIYQYHKSSVLSCAFNSLPPYDIMATGGMDDMLYVFKANKTDPLLTSTFPDSVDCVKFNHDGSYLAASDLGGYIKVFRGKDLSLVHEFQLDEDLRTLVWHHVAPVLVAVGETLIMMYNIPTGECKALPAGNGQPACGKILPDGKRFAYGTREGHVRVIDMKSATATISITLDLTSDNDKISLYDMDTHKDGALMVFGCDVGNIVIVNADNGKFSFLARTNSNSDSEGVEVIAFAKTESHKNLVASGHRNGSIKIWDTSRQALRCHVDYPEHVVSLVWHPSDPVIYSCHPNATINITGALNGDHIKTLQGHQKSILAIDISPDGSRLISVSDDTTARTYNLKETNETVMNAS